MHQPCRLLSSSCSASSRSFWPSWPSSCSSTSKRLPTRHGSPSSSKRSSRKSTPHKATLSQSGASTLFSKGYVSSLQQAHLVPWGGRKKIEAWMLQGTDESRQRIYERMSNSNCTWARSDRMGRVNGFPGDPFPYFLLIPLSLFECLLLSGSTYLHATLH